MSRTASMPFGQYTSYSDPYAQHHWWEDDIKEYSAMLEMTYLSYPHRFSECKICLNAFKARAEYIGKRVVDNGTNSWIMK